VTMAPEKSRPPAKSSAWIRKLNPKVCHRESAEADVAIS